MAGHRGEPAAGLIRVLRPSLADWNYRGTRGGGRALWSMAWSRICESKGARLPWSRLTRPVLIQAARSWATASACSRIMATRESLSAPWRPEACWAGLAAATADVIVTLEASGRDVVIIETVGVGQAEIEVVKLASAVALVLTPSMGDDVQTLKAGIHGDCDVFVVNKADQPGADRIQGQLEALLSLLPAGQARPPIVRTVATDNKGVPALIDALSALPRQNERSVTAWKERPDRHGAAAFDRACCRRDAGRRQDRGSGRAKSPRGRLNPYEFVDEVIAERGCGAEPALTRPVHRLDAETNQTTRVRKIDHIGIAVRSIDATLALYRDALGVDPGPRVVVEHEKVEAVMLPVGGPRLELLEATSGDSVIAKFIEKRGEGLHHIAMRVPDLAAAVERVKAGGGRLVKARLKGEPGDTNTSLCIQSRRAVSCSS